MGFIFLLSILLPAMVANVLADTAVSPVDSTDYFNKCSVVQKVQNVQSRVCKNSPSFTFRKSPTHTSGAALNVNTVNRSRTLWRTSRTRTCETGVCLSSDTVLIPFETQMHSCFSKYPPMETPPSSLILISSLSLPFLLVYLRLCISRVLNMHDLAIWNLFSTTHHEFCMETGDGYSGIHTWGRNGSSGIKKESRP